MSSMNTREEFAEVMEMLRKLQLRKKSPHLFVGETVRSNRLNREPENSELWISWVEAVNWWGDSVGLTEYLLRFGWRAGNAFDPNFQPAIEPIFWEVIKSHYVGELAS